MLTILLIIIAISVISLAFAGYLTNYVLKQDCGTKEMQSISNAIKEGAEAFLRRQYKTIGLLSIFVAAALFLFYNYSSSPNIIELGPSIALKVTFSFILGAACSALAGFIGMFVSIRSSIRAASAARESLNKAMQIALRGGAVSGLTVVSMSLLGVGGLFYL